MIKTLQLQGWLFWLKLEGEIGDADKNQDQGWMRFLGD